MLAVLVPEMVELTPVTVTEPPEHPFTYEMSPLIPVNVTDCTVMEVEETKPEK
jgi:hypothetical protein